MRVVFDTNVFISAFMVSGSQGERALVLAQRGRFQLLTSVAILTETAHKLRDELGQSREDTGAALRLITRAATVLRPGGSLAILDDEPDNRILECAIEGAADLIVTGDRHLLKLKSLGDTTIVRLADFIHMFPAET